MTHREYRREGPYFVLSCLLLLFRVLCGVIFESVLKSIFSIISAAGFRKKQTNRTVELHKNYNTSGCSTELKLRSVYRRGS